MPSNTKFNVIYIGNFADLEAPAGTTGAYTDVDTAYNANEANADLLVGQTFSGKDELAIVEMTAYHRANDSLIGLDSYPSAAYNNGQEGVEYVLPDGTAYGDQVGTRTTGPLGNPDPVPDGVAIDNEIRYNATVTLWDPVTKVETDLARVVNVFQTDTGDVFIQDYANIYLDNLTIKDITFNSVNNYDGDGIVRDSWTITGSGIVCFGQGAVIATENGERAVEDLKSGDRVWTKDNGFQSIRWIGKKTVGVNELASDPKLRPIRIAPDALGHSGTQPLLVSRQHRILLNGPIVQTLTDTDEVLVPAHKLTPLDGVEVAADVKSISYYHILLDTHEVLLANGLECESLYLGPQSIETFDEDSIDEIETFFPELRHQDSCMTPARPFLSRNKEVRPLTDRMACDPVFA